MPEYRHAREVLDVRSEEKTKKGDPIAKCCCDRCEESESVGGVEQQTQTDRQLL